VATNDPSERLLRRLYQDAATEELDDEGDEPPGPEARRLAGYGQRLIGEFAAAVATADRDEVEIARVATLTRTELLAELAMLRAARAEPFDEASLAEDSDDDLRVAVRVLKYLPSSR